MTRPYVFHVPTTLYHPVEGEKTFPVGETDPGAAWTDRIGGEAVGSSTTTQALKDLIAAQEQIEALESRLHANGHDVAVSAKGKGDALAKMAALEQRAIVAEKALAASEAQAQEYMRERDQARVQSSQQLSQLAAATGSGGAEPEAPAPVRKKPGRKPKAAV